jgi:transposase
MMKKRVRRVFDAAFKLDALRRMHEQVALQIPVSVISRELGITPALLRNWAQQQAGRVGQSATDVFPGEGRWPSADAELRQLRREVETVRMERDFLKRAASDSTGRRNTIG